MGVEKSSREELVLIDFHVHPPTKEFLVDSLGIYGRQTFQYFKIPFKLETIENMLEEFDSAGVQKMVLFAWDAETRKGLPKTSNDYIAEIVEKYPDRFIGFASVDPHKGRLAEKELERAVKDLSLKGLKFQQSVQEFYPNDKKFYPLYSKAEELKIPVVFHMGATGIGSGIPGGGGFRLKYTRPIYVDDVAVDFPELTIVCAHPAWPWHDEALAIALHKSNVYIDLSGWSPKYIPESVIRYATTILSDKTLFGTDYPFIKPNRWLRDFRALNIKPDVERKILGENAKKILGL